MMNTAVAKRYGQALLQIGQEKNAIDQYQDELKLVVDTIDNNAELKEILISQTVSSDKKKAIVKDLFGAQTDKNIMNLLYVVIDKNREEYLASIYETYCAYADEVRDILPGLEGTATP